MAHAEGLPPAGRARLSDAIDSATAGTYETLTIEYTVGRFGMDDGSRLIVAFSQTSDWTRPQFDRPRIDGYSTVTTTGAATVRATYDPNAWIRPFAHGILIDVTDGSLEPGERIVLTLGDRSAGCMGQRQQSFCETDFTIHVLADPVRTGEFVPVETLTFDVHAAPASRLEGVLPATAPPQSTVELCVRALDRWGNPARDYDGTLSVSPVDGTIESPDPFESADGVATTQLSVSDEGVYRVEVRDRNRGIVAISNPLVVGDDFPTTYWGDIHGQSGETVGTGTVQEYFSFARTYGLLDFASHAGNDFQITDAFWEEIRQTVRDHNTPGAFVTFPCFEWSGNTPMGGDHNVYFRDDDAAEDEPIRRSHSWLVTDDDHQRSAGTSPVNELYEAYTGRDDVMIVPHQGGRPARLDDVDPDLAPGVEIASVWGVFEWFGREAIERGLRPALFASSDDHTGRPGVATPDNLSKHNIRGGLVAVQADSLSREAIWEAFQERRLYGTTGVRILLDLAVNGVAMGESLTVPAGESVEVTARIHGTDPVQRATLFRDGRALETHRFPTDDEEWIELAWQGAKGTGRDKVIEWSGGCTLEDGEIGAAEAFGFDHPDQGIHANTPTSIEWVATTTGNRQGVRFRPELRTDTATLRVNTPPISVDVDLSELPADRPERYELPEYLDCSLAVHRTGRPTDRDATISFTDELPATGAAYYLRVTQWDGAMAWSSPVFIDPADD